MCGCHKEPSLVGDWTGEMEFQKAKITATTHFGADGSFTMVLPIRDPRGMGLDTKMIGTWKKKEDNLELHVTDAQSNPIGLSPQETRAFKVTLDSHKSQVIEQVNMDPDYQIKWSGDDTITLTNQGTSRELHRVKK